MAQPTSMGMDEAMETSARALGKGLVEPFGRLDYNVGMKEPETFPVETCVEAVEVRLQARRGVRTL